MTSKIELLNIFFLLEEKDILRGLDGLKNENIRDEIIEEFSNSMIIILDDNMKMIAEMWLSFDKDETLTRLAF